MAAVAAQARGLRNACLIAAGVGVVLLVLAGRQGGPGWLPSYLFVWLFVLGLSLGSLAWVTVHNLTGGNWGQAVRPFAQAALRLFPLCALLAVPLLFAPVRLLPWMNSTAGAADVGLVAGQHWYLNSAFFYLRGIVYFAIWIALAWLLRDPGPRRPLQGVSAAGFVLYALTATFAAVDWTMSLTPPWHSTVFGLLIGTGQALAALAGAILCANALGAKAPAPEVDAPRRARFHDLGNLSLALVLVWAYLAFMQFLIMWIEDLPDEIAWLLLRSRTSWSVLTGFVVVTHFVLPFLLLLSRGAKRSPGVLAWIGALVLLACLADSFWLVVPIFRPQGFELRWSDLGALLAIGGLWLGCLIFVIGLPAAHPLHGGLAPGSGEHGTQRA
ncbi:MAG: hypothetical protein ABSH33_18730 [Steroidobacteraceae bacterium]|jgi:hypothetical protein